MNFIVHGFHIIMYSVRVWSGFDGIKWNMYIMYCLYVYLKE